MCSNTYTGEPVHPVGVMCTDVDYKGQIKQLNLFIIDGVGPPLLGREWLKEIKLDWHDIAPVNHMSSDTKQDLYSQGKLLLDNYSDVFKDELGTMKKIKAKLHVKEGATPKFFKARAVPYSLQSSVSDELDRLEKCGIITKVTQSEWAAPIVPVVKSDSSVRICGDFKVTINPYLHPCQYPTQRIEDMFATLAGGEKFSKIDLAHAYQQMELDKDSQGYLTINTSRGLYQYTRLPFGVACAPGLFQQAMDQILQGLPRVLCYQDDILITGVDDKDHISNLKAVLERLSSYGLRVKRNKCSFFADNVQYIGHKIDKHGLHTSQDKVTAIVDAPAPENVPQLRSYLGLINYYRSFLPNLATVLYPLNNLLQKSVKWYWSSACETAFKRSKDLVLNTDVLIHFDINKPIVLAVDASPYGLGAVLSHVLPDNSERPIAFASRTLNKTEKGYSQIDKEALAIVFGVKRFHQYIYGNHFTLITDHRPLTALFNPKKSIPTLAAARMQRWALMLAAYDYSIKYRTSSDNANADCLSRLPLKCHSDGYDRPDHVEIFLNCMIEQLPLTAQQVKTYTRNDPLLAKVFDATMDGWKWEHSKDPDLEPFYRRRNELSIHQGCVLWGIRVIVPFKLQKPVLCELHEGHAGIVRMKSLARSYIWWPNIDADIERLAKECYSCQQVQGMPTTAPVHPWSYPTAAWQRVHLDFAGPFMENMFLIAVDAYSKWPEITIMRNTTAAELVKVVRGYFVQHGLPLQIVTDNGPQFVSEHFESFLKSNGVKHTLSAPYKPSTNGLAERMVQTFKQAMKSATNDKITLPEKLDRFLLRYRTTPHSVTQETPAKLHLNRELRTKWDLLRPKLTPGLASNNNGKVPNRSARQLRTDQNVWIRNYGLGDKWLKGKVVTCDGPRYYTVKVSNQNYVWRRHIDQLREREVTYDNNGVSDEQVINPSENSDDLNQEVPDIVHVNSANSGDSDDVDVTSSIGNGNQDTTHTVMSDSQEVSEKNDISNSTTISTDSNNINNSNNVRRSKRTNVKRPSRYC